MSLTDRKDCDWNLIQGVRNHKIPSPCSLTGGFSVLFTINIQQGSWKGSSYSGNNVSNRFQWLYTAKLIENGKPLCYFKTNVVCVFVFRKIILQIHEIFTKPYLALGLYNRLVNKIASRFLCVLYLVIREIRIREAKWR